MNQLALNFSTRTLSQTQGANLRRVRSGIAPHILEFFAARRMLGQLEINRLALSVSNIKAQTINVDHAERLIREDACGVLDWLAGALGVEVGE